MKRHLMAIPAAGLAAALALTACGSDSKHDTSLSLVVADYGNGDGSTQAYWNGVISQFNAKYPGVKVNLQVIGWTDIDGAVTKLIQNGKQPDILQTGGYADKVADDLLYPVDKVLSPQVRSDVIDAFVPPATVDGTQYGIPFTSSTRLLIYNTDLFAKAGIAAPPQTWDELRADAQKLKNSGAPTPYGLPLGKEEAQGEFMNWMLGNGGGYQTDGKYTLNSQANVDTLTWIDDNLVKTGLTEPNPGTKNRQDMFTDFYNGSVGMLNSNPTMLAQLAKHPNTHYATAPIPGRTGPLTNTLGVCDWLMAFKKNGHQEQIRNFLDIAMNTQNSTTFQENNYFTPVTKSATEKMAADPRFTAMKPYLDLLPKARFYPLNDTSWDVLSPKVKAELGLAAGTKPPKDVLDQLQKEALDAVAQQQ